MTTERTGDDHSYNAALFETYCTAAEALFDRAIAQRPPAAQLILLEGIEAGTIARRMATVLSPQPYVLGFLTHTAGGEQTPLFVYGTTPVDETPGAGL